jgi:hypothetical protein
VEGTGKHGHSALERALDPRSNVALRANVGGLAQIAAGEERLAERRSRVMEAMEDLREKK